MTELIISDNQIASIQQSRIELLANLEALDISCNHLTVLPTFNNMNNLVDLYCSNNEITYVEANHFLGSVLVNIELNENPLTITEIIIPQSLEKLMMKETAVQTLTIRCTVADSCTLKLLQLESEMLESPIINEVKPTLRSYSVIGTTNGIPTGGLRSDAFTNLPNLGTLQLHTHSFDPYLALSQVQIDTVESISLKGLHITDDSLLFGAEGLMAHSNLDFLALGSY